MSKLAVVRQVIGDAVYAALSSQPGTQAEIAYRIGVTRGDVQRIRKAKGAPDGLSLDKLLAVMEAMGKTLVVTWGDCEPRMADLREGAIQPAVRKAEAKRKSDELDSEHMEMMEVCQS